MLEHLVPGETSLSGYKLLPPHCVLTSTSLCAQRRESFVFSSSFNKEINPMELGIHSFLLLLSLYICIPSPTLCLLPSKSLLTLAFTTLLSVSTGYAYMPVCSLATLFQSPQPLPSEICSMYPCSSPILFVSLFCSLDSTCK